MSNQIFGPVPRRGKPQLRKRNQRPEKIVEAECMAWMQSKGWSMQIYESKAKFINGRWAQSGLAFGTSDAQGNTDLGHAAYVEFKAPGRLSSYNAEKNFRQRAYIEGKILTNAFAVVVDSAWRLSEIYEAWVEVRESGHELARSYLFAVLP